MLTATLLSWNVQNHAPSTMGAQQYLLVHLHECTCNS